MAEERALLEAAREAWLSGEGGEESAHAPAALAEGAVISEGAEEPDAPERGDAPPPPPPPPAHDPPACTWPALSTIAPGLRVNLELEDDDRSRVHHRIDRDGDLIVILFDERGADAHFSGEDRFRCVGSTLVLEETAIDGQRIRFAPPIPVLAPADAALGEPMETTLLIREDERHWSLTGTWTATVQEVEGPPSLHAPGRTFYEVRSRLAFDTPEAGPWQTVTVWAVGDGDVFVAARSQQVREAGPGDQPVIHTRVVRAQWVFRDEGPESRPPQN